MLPTIATKILHSAIPTEPASKNEWVVEAFNTADEGQILTTTFSGLWAKKRAHDYANWMNTSLCAPGDIVQLKSGGPTMHILEITAAGKVRCAWSVKTGAGFPQIADFSSECLIQIK